MRLQCVYRENLIIYIVRCGHHFDIHELQYWILRELRWIMKNIMRWLSFFLICTFCVVGNAFYTKLAYAVDSSKIFYVALNGNDQWSGLLSKPNAIGDDGPFATPQKALDVVAELKKQGAHDAFVVEVREGTYFLSDTLVFNRGVSGTTSKPFVFKSFSNEHPILSGCRKINNFEVYKGSIYKAKLTGVARVQSPTRQLIADGKLQDLARYPNFDFSDPVGGGFLYVESSVEGSLKSVFKYHQGVLPTWSSIKDCELFIFSGYGWRNNIVPVAQIDRASKKISVSQNVFYEILPNNRYYLRNFLAALDSPGEWYFDSQNQELYFWPPNLQSLKNTSLSILENVISIEYNATDIQIKGFIIEGCVGSAVVANGTQRVLFSDNTVRFSGRYGIELQSGFDNIIDRNEIYKTGKSAVVVSGGVVSTLKPTRNQVVNNHIYEVGVFYKYDVGVYCMGVGNVVSHNLIHSVPRSGISFNGNDHLIEYNHIYDVNKETKDSGIIYCSQVDWTKRGNIIRYNYLHGSGGYGFNRTTGQWASPYYTWGIYIDDWSSGTLVYGNIVTDTANGGVFIHSGRDNVIENNILINGAEYQMTYSAWPVTNSTAQYWLPKMFATVQNVGSAYAKYPLLSNITSVEVGAAMSGNSFVRNIVDYDDPNAQLYAIFHSSDFSTTVSDYNVLYHNELPLKVAILDSTNQPWENWKGKGLDQHSIVSDPKIADISRGNFTLASDSPALSLGFIPIPFDKIGISQKVSSLAEPSNLHIQQ